MNVVHKERSEDAYLPDFPVKTHIYTKDIFGTETTLIISEFDDHTFICLTRIGKPGTFLSVDIEKSTALELTSSLVRPIYTVNVLFGYETQGFLLLARLLAENIGHKKSVILALGFRQPLVDSQEIKTLVNFIKSNLI